MILIDNIKLSAGESLDTFTQKLEKIASILKVEPSWLMFIMWFESRLNPKSVNPKSGATGLIQFMPQVAKGLGTSTQSLLNMNATDQLTFVYQYFKPYAGRMKNVFDMYLVTFFPAALGKPKDFIIQAKSMSAEMIAKMNPVFDIDKNGSITVGEIIKVLIKSMPKEAYNKLVGVKKNL